MIVLPHHTLMWYDMRDLGYGLYSFPYHCDCKVRQFFLYATSDISICVPFGFYLYNHMPCVYFSCVVDFALGVLT